jgi:DNA-directed RNA polymerase specialized sigma24 family protein
MAEPCVRVSRGRRWKKTTAEPLMRPEVIPLGMSTRERMIETPLRLRAIVEPSCHFRTIFDAHFRLVWISLSRLGVHEPDLIELTQEVFLEAYRRQAELRNPAGPSVWICGICRAVVNQYVLTGAAGTRAGVASLSLPEGSEDASGYTVDHSPDGEHINRSLDKLTRRQRLVFIFFELDALSGVEIGALLGIGLRRVYRLLYAARATFLREAARPALRDAPLR